MLGRKLQKSSSTTVVDQFDTVNLPQAVTPIDGECRVDLSKFQIKDHLAMGGMSELERERHLMMDVFLTAEERSWYENKEGYSSRDLGLDVPHEVKTSNDRAQDLFLQVSAASRDTAFDLSKVETPLPPKGPFGLPSAPSPDLSFAPEGLLAPKGLLMPQGLLAPQGLMSSREPSSFPDSKTAAPQINSINQTADTSLNEQVKKNFQPTDIKSAIPSPWQHKTPSPFAEVISKMFSLILMLLGFSSTSGYRGGRPEQGRQ